MQPRRLFESAPKAQQLFAQPACASTAPSIPVAGPSRFSGCLAWYSAFSSSSGQRSAHEPLCFLHPPSCLSAATLLVRASVGTSRCYSSAAHLTRPTLQDSTPNHEPSVPRQGGLHDAMESTSSPSVTLRTQLRSAMASIDMALLIKDQTKQLSDYLEQDGKDTQRTIQWCRRIRRLIMKQEGELIQRKMASARILYLQAVRILLDKRMTKEATLLFQDMLTNIRSSKANAQGVMQEKEKEKVQASGIADVEQETISMAQWLMEQLTMIQKKEERHGSILDVASRGFTSDDELRAALSLWKHLRQAKVARTTVLQSALVKALQRYKLTLMATSVFQAEVQSWWDSIKKTGSYSANTATAPSSQSFRDIRHNLIKLENLLTDILNRSAAAQQDVSLSRLKEDYAKSLFILSQLLRTGQLPFPSATNRGEIAWIISACCRFESRLKIPVRGRHCTEPSLLNLAQKIRHCMSEYIRHLPTGLHDVNSPSPQGLPPRPPLDLAMYNQLIHYSMSVLESPQLCKIVFEHMTNKRKEKLEPDHITYNIILRQATTKRFESLAKAVLSASEPKSSENEMATSTEDEVNDGHPMLFRIDDAIARADSYRLVSLIQYVASTGRFLTRHRSEPGYINVKEVVFRLYPTLDIRHRISPRKRYTYAPSLITGLSKSADRNALRPIIGHDQRYASLNPHVLSATLNLASKAGKTGLALRVWRLLKRTSLESHRPGQTSAQPWKIPVEAATTMMQVLANEGRKYLKVLKNRSYVSARSKISFNSPYHRVFARGWNVEAANTETQRWKAARKVAKSEYLSLLDLWNLVDRSAVLERDSGKGLIRTERLDRGVFPDERFYDAILDVFSRQPGMKARSRLQRNAGEVVRRLQDARTEMIKKGEDAQVNSAGRFTAREPDLFLLTLLKDMETLDLPIPLGYRWLVKDRTFSQPTIVGSLNIFRNSRIKDVGKISQR